MALGNSVTIGTATGDLPRCFDWELPVEVDVTLDSVSALEFVLEYSTAAGDAFMENVTIDWNLPAGVLSNQPAPQFQADGISPDTVRFAAMRIDAGDGVLTNVAAQAEPVVATISFKTTNSCGGDVVIGNCDSYFYPNPSLTGPITTQFVDAEDGSVVAVGFTDGGFTVVNQDPTIDAIADIVIPHSQAWTMTATGDDPDLVNLCESLTFSLVSPPSGMTIGGTTGVINWTPGFTQVCNHSIEVKVTDECLAFATTTFNICVSNEPPEFLNCPGEVVVATAAWGQTLTYDLEEAVDPDNDPADVHYYLASFERVSPSSAAFPPAVLPVVNEDDGSIIWDTDYTAEYTGIFKICVEATDGSMICDDPDPLYGCNPENADTCCFLVEIIPFEISIAKLHGTAEGTSCTGVIQGQIHDVPITMLNSTYVNHPMGGFDFLIAYDASALTFMEAIPGAFIDNPTGPDCGWEYFTYRYGAFGNCGNGCPSGLLRIVAMAETNNGANHPTCFTNDVGISNELAVMRFLVSNDHTLECTFAPIRFYWIDCGDNAISNVAGDTLFLEYRVWNYTGDGFSSVDCSDTDDSWVLWETPAEYQLPGSYGVPDEECALSFKDSTWYLIDFRNGGIDIACHDSIDAPGDINVNGLAYEIADAVMFTNYFIEGLTAFGPTPLDHQDASIAASDCNKDGLTLSVADLVYLIRVVIGDAMPYPKTAAVDANYSFDNGTLAFNTELGGVYLVVDGVCTPELVADNMVMQSKVVDGQTRIIATLDPNSAEAVSITGTILSGVSGDIVVIEAANLEGAPLDLNNVPTSYSLDQNYPNPFNPTTTIAFSLPTAGEFQLAIYNIQGQVVDTYSGNADVGNYTYEWDASGYASGIYLYRLTAGNFSDVKKMVFLK